MDPLSFTASLVAVAGLPKTAYRLARTARSIARDFKTVGEELPYAVEHVEQSAKIIATAQGILKMYCQRQGEGRSEIIPSIEAQRVPRYLEEESKRIKGYIRGLNMKVASLQGRPTFWFVLKWRTSLKDELEKLRVRMQFIQSNLLLLQGTLQMEAAWRRRERDDIEISYLRKTIKQSIWSIRRLEKRMELFIKPDTNDDSLESLLPHTEVECIMELANKSIREKRPAHGGHKSSNSSGNHIHGRGQGRRTEAFESGRQAERQGPVEESRASEKEPIIERRNEQRNHPRPRKQNAQRPTRDNGSDRLTPKVGPPEPPGALGNGSIGRDVVEDQHHDSSSRAAHSDVASSSSQSHDPVHPPLTRNPSEASAGTESSGFMDVRALSDILEMKVSDGARGISGYIEDGNGRRHYVTAILEPKQEFNLMSYRKASELSLLKAIEPYTEETMRVRIQNVRGRLVRPLGKVLVRWAAKEESHDAFSLEFWVAPFEGDRNLVMGGPFVSKSRWYQK